MRLRSSPGGFAGVAPVGDSTFYLVRYAHAKMSSSVQGQLNMVHGTYHAQGAAATRVATVG